MIKAVVATIALVLPCCVPAEECPKVPNEIAKAIGVHILKLGADEYCTARSVRTDGKITALSIEIPIHP